MQRGGEEAKPSMRDDNSLDYSGLKQGTASKWGCFYASRRELSATQWDH